MARFFLTFFQTFITDNNNFYKEFITVWNKEIKPLINEKFPIQSSGHFNLNSDISFLVQLIDETLKEKTIIKKGEDKIEKMKIFFTESNKEELGQRRTNSMIGLRPHSQTIDSKTTRDSSIKRKNSGLNKEISQKKLNIINDLNENKPEIDKEKQNINKNNEIENLTEEKKDKNSINENNENIQKNEFTFEEFLNKIINDNYIYENVTLIHHFCQQCFCFIKVETLFDQIFYCYKSLKKNDLEIQLNKLIEFSNVLVIEMIRYYKDENTIDVFISMAKEFYCKLISDLIINLIENDLEKKEEKNEIKPVQLNDCEDNIINMDMNNKQIENYEINKNNLINMNLNEELLLVSFQIEKDDELKLRKSKSNSVVVGKLCRKAVHFDDKEKIIKEIKENNDNEETKKLLQSSKSLGKSKHLSLNKNNVKEPIKEEDEKNEESDDNKKEKRKKSYDINSDKEDKNNNEIKLKTTKDEKESKEKNKIKKEEIIESIMKKINISENIISLKEEHLIDLEKAIIILEKAEEKEETIDIYIKNIKKEMNFYKELQKKTKGKYQSNLTDKQRQKPMTKNNTTFFAISKKYLSKGYFCVTDWKTEEIGNQLMIISKSLLNKIHPRELYKAKFLKKDKEFTSPNVMECINTFNRLTSFIIEDILSYNKPKERAKIYEKWVLIADYCRENKDYNDLIAIFSAFNHYVITGLKLTLKEVKSKTNIILNKLRHFCAVEGNYKKIREDMDNCNKNGVIFIPYLGMLLRDINFFEEKSKYINENGSINFEKIEKISEMFELYFKFKNKSDDKTKIPELDFFKDLNDITEEELECIADDLEPEFKFKVKHIKRKRLTKIDEKYFSKYKSKDDKDSDNEDDNINNEPVDLDTAFCN